MCGPLMHYSFASFHTWCSTDSWITNVYIQSVYSQCLHKMWRIALSSNTAVRCHCACIPISLCVVPSYECAAVPLVSRPPRCLLWTAASSDSAITEVQLPARSEGEGEKCALYFCLCMKWKDKGFNQTEALVILPKHCFVSWNTT